MSGGLCTSKTTGTGKKDHNIHEHAEVIIPNPNKLSMLRHTKNFTKPVFRIINTHGTHTYAARSQK